MTHTATAHTATTAPTALETIIIDRMPPAFVRDCEECDCDVGVYNPQTRNLVATSDQLAELVSRAQHYAFDGCDCSFGLKRSALATLKAVARVQS